MKKFSLVISLFILVNLTWSQVSESDIVSYRAHFDKKDSFHVAFFPIDFSDIDPVLRANFPSQTQWDSILNTGAIPKWFQTESFGTTIFSAEVFPYTTSNDKFLDGGNVLDYQSILDNIDLSATNFKMSDYDFVVIITAHDAAVYQSITTDKTFKINGTSYTQPVVCASYQNGNWARDLINYPNPNDQLKDTINYVVATGPDAGYEGPAIFMMSAFESVLLHEIGHSLGISSSHANSSTNSDKYIYETEVVNNADFLNNDYGNKYDIMGKREYSLSMNSVMKDWAGLLDTSHIERKNWWGKSTHTVKYKYDSSGKNYIEVQIPDQRNFIGKNYGYGLEIREAIKYDTMLSLSHFTGNLDGFFVYKIDKEGHKLLDMSPSANLSYQGSNWADIRDVVLKSGMTYQDDDIMFENVVNNNDGTWSVDITIKPKLTVTQTPLMLEATRNSNNNIDISWTNNCSDCQSDQIFFIEWKHKDSTKWTESIVVSDLAKGNYTFDTAPNGDIEFRGYISGNSSHYESLYSNIISTDNSTHIISNMNYTLQLNNFGDVLEFSGFKIDEKIKLDLYDVSGSLISAQWISKEKSTVNIVNLSNGVYVAKFGSSHINFVVSK